MARQDCLKEFSGLKNISREVNDAITCFTDGSVNKINVNGHKTWKFYGVRLENTRLYKEDRELNKRKG